jgi:hypothetical protein
MGVARGPTRVRGAVCFEMLKDGTCIAYLHGENLE